MMEGLSKEISLRLGKRISPLSLEECIKTSSINPEFVREVLRKNYALMIPLAWILKKKNTTREELLHLYTKETTGANATYNNRPIERMQKKEGVVRFVTYNVHYWSDPYQTPDLDDILDVIKRLDADVMAIQEALLPYHPSTKNKLTLLGHMEEIQTILETDINNISNRGIKSTDGWKCDDLLGKIETTGFKYIASSAASTTHSLQGTFFGNAVMSSTKYAMGASLGVTLPPYGQGRSATWCYIPNLKIQGAHQGVVVVSVHLDVFDDSGKARRLQLIHLIDHLNSIMVSKGGHIRDQTPIIIMGDLNSLKKEDYIDHELEWLQNNNQQQPLDLETIKIIEDAGYRDVFYPCSLKSTTWAARRTDYIYVKNIPDDSIDNTYVYYSDRSDHIPLMVDIKIETL